MTTALTTSASPAGQSSPLLLADAGAANPAPTVARKLSDAAVTGKVVDAQGKPVNGAHVYVETFCPEQKYTELITDAAGHYAGEVDLSYRWEPDSPLQILAWAPGYALTSDILDTRGNIITLNTGASLSGTVTDRAGKPLAGVPVRLERLTNAQQFRGDDTTVVPELWRARFTATSGADGAWTLSGLPQTCIAWVSLNDDRYVREQQIVTVFAGKMAQALHLTAHPGAVVTGRVLTPVGTPAAGMHIRIIPQENQSPNTDDRETAADGGYRVTGLAPGRYNIWADSGDELTSAAFPPVEFTLSEGRETVVPDMLSRLAAMVTGRILTPEGTPAAGAYVYLDEAKNNRTRGCARTGVDGRYRIGVLKAGSYTIKAVSADNAWLAQLPADITLTEGNTTSAVDLHAHRGAGVTGTLVDAETGLPVVNLPAVRNSPFIYCYSDHTFDRQHSIGVARVDQRGHFFLRLPAGSCSLLTTFAGYGYLARKKEEAVPVVLEEGRSIAVTMKVHRGNTVMGTLTDDKGQPMAGMYSFSCTPKPPDGTPYPRDIVMNIVTDQQGHFTAAGLPAGSYYLNEVTTQTTDAWQLPEPPLIQVPAKAPVTIALKRLLPDMLMGKVVENGVTPMAGVRVCCRVQQAEFHATTDQQGRFTITGVPAGQGKFGLDPEQPAYPRAQLSCYAYDLQVPMRAPLIVKLTRRELVLHTVSGRVVDTQHHPLAGVTVTASLPYSSSAAAPPPTALTGADGRYQFQGLPDGQQAVTLLSVVKKGYRQCLAGVLSSDGYDTIADAVMAPCTATVHGTVCDAAGQAIAGATVVSAEGGVQARAITDAVGAFTLPEQPEGELHLVAATPTGGGVATVPAPSRSPGRTRPSAVVITCTPGLQARPVDLQLAQRVLELGDKLPQEQRRSFRSEALHLLADVDLALTLKLAQSGTEPLSEGLRAYLLGKQAQHDPAKVGDILVQLNMLNAPTCKLYAAVEMGMAVAKSDPDLAEQLYQIAKPLYDKVEHNTAVDKNIEGLAMSGNDLLVHMMALSGTLQKTADVDVILTHVNELSAMPQGTINPPLRSVFEAAMRVSPAFLNTVYQRLQDKHKQIALVVAALSLAQYDPVAAGQAIALNNIAADAPTGIPGLRLLLAVTFQPKAEAEATITEAFSHGENRTLEVLALANAVDA